MIADVHGDWRAPTRLYGSRARRLLDPLADALARLGLRRADGIRTISGYTSGLVRAAGREPDAEFPAYMDLEPFLGPPAPLPETPTALFVGVLERYKAIDVLAEAWPTVRERIPSARLHVVGSGSLPAPAGEGIEWSRSLSTARGRRSPRRGDAARPPLALGGNGPCSRRGVPPRPRRRRHPRRRDPRRRHRRRDRPARRAGTIPPALADALVRVLADPELAGRFGQAAHRSAGTWAATPQEFAARMRELVERVTRLPA